MLITILTLGLIGDYHKLRLAAKKNRLSLFVYKCYIKRRQSYIPITADIGDDIIFPHLSGIFIASFTHIGKGCKIFQNCTIGSIAYGEGQHYGCPHIGNNVIIGANSCIVGGVRIGDNVKIGAGCIISEDIPSNCTVVMDKPRIIYRNND